MTSFMFALLRRYWIEFEDSTGSFVSSRWPKVCGVTAYSINDAFGVIQEHFDLETPEPGIRELIEDVDISTLDERHVLPTIGVVVWRGVWYFRI